MHQPENASTRSPVPVQVSTGLRSDGQPRKTIIGDKSKVCANPNIEFEVY